MYDYFEYPAPKWPRRSIDVRLFRVSRPPKSDRLSNGGLCLKGVEVFMKPSSNVHLSFMTSRRGDGILLVILGNL
jgi:hypothetical protein